MALQSQAVPTTKSPHFATLLLMALAPEEVGQRIESARKARGWTHEQLRDAISDQVGRRINVRTVQRWQKGRDPKTGKSWLPRLGTLMELADVLEVSRSYFVDQPQVSDEVAEQLGALATEQARQAAELDEHGDMLAEILRRLRDDPAADGAASS